MMRRADRRGSLLGSVLRVALCTALLGGASDAWADEDAGGATADKDVVLSDELADEGVGGVAMYERMVQNEPGNPEAHQLLAIAYAELEKFDAARREIGVAISLVNDGSEMYQALGLIEERAKRPAEAEAAYRKALTIHGNVDYRLDLARVLLAQNRDVEASDVYRQIETEFAADKNVQVTLADELIKLGQYEKAFAAYDRAIALAPDDVELLIAKARAHGDRGDLQDALNVLSRAKTLAPGDATVLYNVGIVYYRLKQLDAAIKAFEGAVEIDENFAKAFNNLGVALDKKKRYDEAVLAFERALKADPDFVNAQYNLGLQNFKLKRWKQAEATFLKALEMDPDLADAKFYLGEIYYQLGEPSKALKVYKEALKTNPDDAATHRRIGDLYLEKGDLNAAIEEYWAAVNADDRVQENVVILMAVLMERNDEGDVRRAIKLGEDALDKDPHALDTRVALAEAYVLHNQVLSARETLEEGLAQAPNDPRLHAAYGTHLLEHGDINEGEKQFKKALELDSKNTDAMFGMARLAMNKNDTDGAIARLQDTLKLAPGNAAARAELGGQYLRKQQYKLALKELKRATEDNPKLGTAWFYLGFTKANSGDVAGAEAAFREAGRLQPDLAEAHFQLGRLLLRGGRKPEAKAAFQAAVNARRNYDEAILELEKLVDVQ